MNTTAAPPRRFYGWKKDRTDKGDQFFRPMAGIGTLPAVIDLRPWCPPAMDQGQLGSCTAHGITGVLRFNRIRQGLGDLPLSRLQLYYDERLREGTVDEDAGAEIRDGVDCVNANGVAPEEVWPYDISKFTLRPPPECYDHKGETVAVERRRVAVDPFHIRAALALRRPIVLGIDVFKGFESDEAAETGVIPMPKAFETPIGGHCTFLWGYGGNGPTLFDGRNSWGPDWGDDGNYHIHEEYIASPKFASDLWLINSVTVAA